MKKRVNYNIEKLSDLLLVYMNSNFRKILYWFTSLSFITLSILFIFLEELYPVNVMINMFVLLIITLSIIDVFFIIISAFMFYVWKYIFSFIE